jgi:hypothetical protein
MRVLLRIKQESIQKGRASRELVKRTHVQIELIEENL